MPISKNPRYRNIASVSWLIPLDKGIKLSYY